MKLTERDTHLYSFLFSLIFHLILLVITIPQFIKEVPNQEVRYRVPIQMQVVKEQIIKKKTYKVTRKTKKKQARKKYSKAKSVKEKPQRLPGDRDLPALTNRIIPVYPKKALNNDWEGTVIIEVVIASSGKVISAEVIKSSGYAVLDQTFIRTVRQYYTFKPKRVSGKNVQGKRKLSYTFSLD